MNINKKDRKVAINLFRPRANKAGTLEEGVSVVRNKFARFNFCRFHCKCQEDIESNRAYFGLAFINVRHIRESIFGTINPDVVSTPLEYETYRLPQHADIYYGLVIPRGQPLPNDLNFAIESIYKKSSYLEDKFPSNKRWKGIKEYKNLS